MLVSYYFTYFMYLTYFGLKQHVTKSSGSDTAPEEGLQNSSAEMSTAANSTLSLNRLGIGFNMKYFVNDSFTGWLFFKYEQNEYFHQTLLRDFDFFELQDHESFNMNQQLHRIALKARTVASR